MLVATPMLSAADAYPSRADRAKCDRLATFDEGLIALTQGHTSRA